MIGNGRHQFEEPMLVALGIRVAVAWFRQTLDHMGAGLTARSANWLESLEEWSCFASIWIEDRGRVRFEAVPQASGRLLVAATQVAE